MTELRRPSFNDDMRNLLREEFEEILEHCESHLEPEPEPEPVPVQPIIKMKPYTAFRRELENSVDWGYNNGITNFIFGIYIALVFPRLGWGILTAVWFTPTYIVIKNSEWFTFTYVHLQDLLSIAGICSITEAASRYCLMKALG